MSSINVKDLVADQLSGLANFARNLYHLRNIDVISVQMGKVGSTSILKSIDNCYQGHSWDPDLPEKYFSAKNNSTWPGYLFSRFRWGLKYRIAQRALNRSLKSSRRVKLVIGVREPISRNISGYFQSLNKRNNDFCVESHIVKFFSHVPHLAPIYWFENEIKRHFGIDVYEKPFNKEDGYSSFSHGPFDVFIYKLEKIKNIEMPLAKFLNLENVKLKLDNRQEDKKTGELYKAFKSRIKFTKEYCDLLYNTKYTKHFYSNEEIISFIKNWCEN